MSWNRNKFWLESFKEFLSKLALFPKTGESLEKNMNSISKLILIISIFLIYFFNIKTGILFLLICMIFLITIYYSFSSIDKENIKENFTFLNKDNKMKQSNNNLAKVYAKVTQPVKTPPRSAQFATPVQPLQNNQTQYSLNQQLADGRVFMSPYVCEGGTCGQQETRFAGPNKVNPNTLKAPVVVPPIWDITSWKANDFVNFSRINEERIQDKYQSGYYVSDRRCTSKGVETSKGQPETKFDRIYYDNAGNEIPEEEALSMYRKSPVKKVNQKENYDTNYLESNYSLENISPIIEPIGKNFPYAEGVDLLEDESYQQPGDVLTIAGYNPTNLKHNLPSNAAFGECEKQDVYNEYNKDLYTQTIQPGYLSRSQIIEPISSNIGISYDQQFLPTTLEKDGNNLVYQEWDPRQYKPKPEKEYIDVVSQDNVYDPRFTGYGSSYRTYVDRLTGQPRHYYDDVDAIRRPNYITRNKIDTFDFAETYGPMKDRDTLINNNDDIRNKVQEKFLNDQLSYRTGLQESLMRKRNNELWELRKFPQSRAGQTSCKC